ncbi:DUF6895 family protein [Streptomyces sp. NPDC048604]|uniref:DUF6895 family protein n=1 Tax=Streptomyces sp. NPDC048604 TaxID=3365578 RepID=UPI0037151C9B
MDSRSAGPGPDLDEAVARLSAGTLRWLGVHAGYLDSPAGRAELPVTPRVKALLQLALLCHYAARTEPEGFLPTAATAVVHTAWERPGFPRLLTLDPRYAPQFLLMHAALAPAGTAAEERLAALDRLTADGFLTSRRKSPYLHLETRFYAELARFPHRLAPYPELYAAGALAGAERLPVAELDVCNVTHTVFYLCDFGLRDPGLTEPQRRSALRVVGRLTEHCVRRGEWDLTAKLVLAQHCLGADPLRTASGASAVRLLAGVQSPDGAIPGRSAADRAAPDATPVESFRISYQSTVVTALTTLIVSAGRPGAMAAAGAPNSTEDAR